MPCDHAVSQSDEREIWRTDKTSGRFQHQFSGGETYVGVEELVYNEVTYYLIDNEGFFGDAVYRGGLAEGEQYAFFCRAVIEAASRIGFIPDVIHCNDWQTGLILSYSAHSTDIGILDMQRRSLRSII